MSKVAIGLIQNACKKSIKENVQKIEGLIHKAHKMGSQIICLQELSYLPYMATAMNIENFQLAATWHSYPINHFMRLAKKLEACLIVPFFEQERYAYYNSAVCIGPNGTILGKYRKNHIPLNSGFQEKYYFRPGNLGYPVIKTPWANIGLSICWDHWFPEVQRIYGIKGAEIVFTPTAIGYCDRPEAHLDRSYKGTWMTMLRGQAITGGFYLAMVNRVGIEGHLNFYGSSFVAAPDGQILSQLDEKKDSCLVLELDLALVRKWHVHQQFVRDRRTDTFYELVE